MQGFDFDGSSGTAERLPSSFTQLGTMGGAATHTISVAEMPVHSHTLRWGAVVKAAKGDSQRMRHSDPTETAPIEVTEGSQQHNNLQPTMVMQAFICAQGNAFYKYAKELREAAIGEDTEDQVTCCSSFFGRWLGKLPLFG